MDRDRFIQLIAVFIVAGCLVASAIMVPLVNSQRRELQIGFDVEIGDRVPPKYAIAAAALGSFRGIAVDALWYRIERLKQEEKYFEANSLAQWITILQPRFPKVWAFHAWNMAYNISVKTHTADERWDWVMKGVNLLRDEGIPLNPNATGLYRELGWIFFHKMSQYSDDFHWYYKQRFAQEWQEVLGSPTEGATTAQTLARFEPIARAADQYLVFSRLTRDARKTLADLGEQYPVYADSFAAMSDINLTRASELLEKLDAQLRSEDPAVAQALEPVREAIEDQKRRAATDALSMLYEDKPETRPVVEQLEALGLALDVDTLRRIGRLIMFLQYTPIETFMPWAERNLDPADMGIAKMLLDRDLFQGLTSFMPFLRAKVLVDTYNMDPALMYELMELYGAIDWRHPAAHGIYWSFLGVRRAGELLNQTKIDYINTDRQVIHGLQQLMHFGRVTFDPINGRIDLMPDPRFIPAYEDAVYGSRAAVEQSEITQREGTVRNYESGHENFLIKAVLYSYLYGADQQAAEYYKRLRDLYGNKPHNLRDGRYTVTLDDFVMGQLLQDIDMQSVSRQFIDAMIMRGITQGVANTRFDVFERFLQVAQTAHAAYNKKRGQVVNAATGQARLGLPPFREMVVNTYVQFMRNPNAPLIERSRIYRSTPLPLARACYPKFFQDVGKQCEEQNIDMSRAFPRPPGLTDEDLQITPPAPAEDEATIQRQ